MNQHNNDKVTCLIPFFNEDQRIFETLNLVTKTKNIDKIICVDDGSEDKSYKKIKKLYPKIKLLRLEKNQGKSSAVLHGLISVKTKWILLLDADLKNLKISELNTAIKTVKESQKNKLKKDRLDMLILRRSNYSHFVTAIRHDILMSGERILKTKDAIEVFKKPPTGYQLEVAINQYMIEKNKNCCWHQTSLANSYKIDKWSLTQALKKYIEEISGYTSYAGAINYLKQIKNFCKQEAK